MKVKLDTEEQQIKGLFRSTLSVLPEEQLVPASLLLKTHQVIRKAAVPIFEF
jgi:hypothetical protein